MLTRFFTFAWAASVATLLLNSTVPALAQTAQFVTVTDALPGRCYDAATTVPDPANGNRLLIGTHFGFNVQTFQDSACIASDEGPTLTMDTISFLVNAPPGQYITKIHFSQIGSTIESRGGEAFRGANWVVDDDPLIIPSTPTGWEATVDFTGQDKTVVPVAITTFLAAGGGSVRSGVASARDPMVTVELAPLPGVGTPPVETPPTETPPVVLPPVDIPPVNTPPVETPPVALPPVETPPVDTPPADTPPVETPQVVLPPAIENPPVDPFVAAIPVPIPPANTPPVENPPAEETSLDEGSLFDESTQSGQAGESSSGDEDEDDDEDLDEPQTVEASSRGSSSGDLLFDVEAGS